MSENEIWNLSALCRCCHSDGDFKSLRLPYVYNNSVEVYSIMLRETFGITIEPPPAEASYTICDGCILRLRDAANFRHQVITFERKFQEYCRNEQFLHSGVIKEEIDDGSNNDDDMGYRDDATRYTDNKKSTNVQYKEIEIKYDRSLDYENHEIQIKFEAEKETQNEIDSSTMDKPKKEKVESQKKSKKPLVKINKIGIKKKKQIETKQGNAKKVKLPSYVTPIEIDSGETLYCCKICRCNYKREELRQHIRETHKERIYYCKMCDIQFDKKPEFVNHKKTHSHYFKCRFCESVLKSAFSLKYHENAHTREILYKCDICQKEFALKNVLRKHILMHMGLNKRAICETCGKPFNDVTNLKYHVMSVHEKIKRFECPYCPKKFTKNRYFKEHLYYSHKSGAKPVNIRPYSCRTCSEKFENQEDFKLHQKSHLATKEYLCKLCINRFNTRGAYRSHLRLHKGHLPHVCPICNKDFSCKYSMKRHVDEHSGIKNYKCDICQKTFLQPYQVNRHKKNVHDPEKSNKEKVKCDLCKQHVFDIEKHMKCHVYRPFKCDLCSRTYNARGSLNRHVRDDHLGRRQHQCDMCNHAYIRLSTLIRHKKKVHNFEPKTETNFYESNDAAAS